ncbi:MAG: SRPBCC family protein [Proteobacteria bacterium]|nr:SRPBCC family protein [Pseudomonadota bacterium]
MRVEQQIKTGRPIDEVWRFLSDVPAVARCIPGAELGESLGEGRYHGTFHLKVGPLSAKIEGEGRVTQDDATLSGSIEGKGVDRRGGSRIAAVISYRVTDQPEGVVVDIAADITLAGQLSQIGRTGLIEDVAKRLTEEFSEALRERLGAAGGVAPGAPAAPPIRREAGFDAGRALRQSLRKRLRAWLGAMFRESLGHAIHWWNRKR